MSNDSFFITKEYDGFILKTVLKRNFWIPLLLVAICFSVAFFYLRYFQPVFQSSTIIQINNDDKAKDVLDIENINSDPSLNSEIELLRSQLIFEAALGKMNMNVSLFQKGNILTEEKYLSSLFNVQPYELRDSSLVDVPIWVKFNGQEIELKYNFRGKPFRVSGKLNQHLINEHFDVVVKATSFEDLTNPENKDEYYFTFNSIRSLSQRFLGGLEVVPLDPSAGTIQLVYKGFNPTFCKDILNSVVTSFFDFDLDEKKKGSEKILNYIDGQLDSLAQELQLSNDSLIQYQRSKQTLDPESIEGSVSSKINRFQEELFAAQEELRVLSNLNNKLESDPTRLEVYRLIPEMYGSSFETALSARIGELHSLMEKKEDLLYSVTEENAEIKALNQKIVAKMSGIRKSAKAIENRILSNVKVLQVKIGELQTDIYQIPEMKLEYGRLKGIQSLNDKYFNLFTERRVMYGISDAGFSVAHRMLNRPVEESTPIEPNPKGTYSTALGFSVLLSFLILFVAYVRFNDVNYIEDLKKMLPETVSYLGTIPRSEDVMDFSQLVVHQNPKSIITESLRTIRTNLSFVRKEYQTIAISSSISGEGKTFVALNLASIIAMSGKKCIILDLDLRKPKVHLAMGVSNKLGLSNAITGQEKWQDCVQKSEVENLDFISAGTIPPNPSELILSDELKEIIEELKKTYEVIVFDNPPVGVVSDGVQILAGADIPIYIFRSNFSKRNFSDRVEELIEVQKVKHLNVILNGVVGSKKSYGYGYGYYYGSNYSYFDEKKSKKNFLSRIFKS